MQVFIRTQHNAEANNKDNQKTNHITIMKNTTHVCITCGSIGEFVAEEALDINAFPGFADPCNCSVVDRVRAALHRAAFNGQNQILLPFTAAAEAVEEHAEAMAVALKEFCDERTMVDWVRVLLPRGAESWKYQLLQRKLSAVL